MSYYLGIDEGTTGVTALIFDSDFRPIARGYRRITQHYPRAGWVEHDAEEVFRCLVDAVGDALQKSGISPEEILAVGIDHEGETALALSKKTGKPLSFAIVWQDRRTAKRASELKETFGNLFLEKTALQPDAYFSATKWEWILQHSEEARALQKSCDLMLCNMDAYFAWRLTGGKSDMTDASTASRTLLYNVKKGCWDRELCELFGIAPASLPEVGDSMRFFGFTDPTVLHGIKAPITALLNDQQAALLGQGCVKEGAMKTTYGTGCFMLLNTGDTPILSRQGLITTVAWQHAGKRSFALDGGIFVAGAATNWLRDNLGLISSAAETEALALSVEDNGGVYFVPAFSGLSTPYRDPYATGTIVGLTQQTTKAHLVRATLEATAYQVCDLARAMQEDSGISPTLLRCDGGATAKRFLMQFQADMLGLPVAVPACAEATARGTALAAAIGLGNATLETALEFNDTLTVYEPKISEDERKTRLATWHRAVSRAKEWYLPLKEERAILE